MNSKKSQSIVLWIVLILVILATVATSVVIFVMRIKKSSINKISNYQECVAAGYPITLSYPGTCNTPSGQSFVDTSQTND